MLTTKTCNAIFKKPAKDRLYLQRRKDSDNEIWVSDGHWMLSLSPNDIPPEYHYYFDGAKAGESIQWSFGSRSTGSNDLENILSPDRASCEVTPSSTLHQHWNSNKTNLMMRRLNGGDIELYLQEPLLRLVADVYGFSVQFKAEKHDTAVYIYSNSELVGCIMPVKRD